MPRHEGMPMTPDGAELHDKAIAERPARMRQEISGEFEAKTFTPPEIHAMPTVEIEGQEQQFQDAVDHYAEYVDTAVTVSGLRGETAEQLRRFLMVDDNKLETVMMARSSIASSGEGRLQTALGHRVDWFVDQVFPWEEEAKEKGDMTAFTEQEEEWFDQADKAVADLYDEDGVIVRGEREPRISERELKKLETELPLLKARQRELAMGLLEIEKELKDKYHYDVETDKMGGRVERVKKMFLLSFGRKKDEMRQLMNLHWAKNAELGELSQEVTLKSIVRKNNGNMREAVRAAMVWPSGTTENPFRIQ